MPPGLVTVTATAPSAWAGTSAVMVSSSTTSKLVASSPPKVRSEVPVNPVPVSVTSVPPPTGPASGATSVIAGAS